MPRFLSVSTFAAVAACDHMRTFIAGATSTGLSVASRTVEARSSARPAAMRATRSSRLEGSRSGGGAGAADSGAAPWLEAPDDGAVADDASVSVAVSVTNMVADMIFKFGTPAQHERWLGPIARGVFPAAAFALSEPSAGSDAGSLRTRATKVDGGWQLDGQKLWITSGDRAGVTLVMAKTDPAAGARGITAFLVPAGTPGFDIGRHEEKLGLRGSSTVSLSFQGCVVPDDAVLGGLGMGFTIAMTALDGGRCTIGAQALGITALVGVLVGITLSYLMAKQLPGTNTPLTPADSNLRERYLANPIAVFSEVDADSRKKCARTFYVTVMRARILRDAADNGMNGYAIAARIETELPEYQAEAPQYREKERKYHLARVGSMTRKELNEVLKKFEAPDSADAADFIKELKKNWLLAREKQADPRNISQLIELSDNYIQLAEDKESAIRILKQAYETSPGTQLLSDLLTEYGLALHKGVWMPKKDVPAMPADPIGAAIREGEVKVGMNIEQVRSSLGIEPSRKTRVVTSSSVQEWWLFEDHGLSIQFTRRRRNEPAVVSRVTTIRTAAPVPVPQKKPVDQGP